MYINIHNLRAKKYVNIHEGGVIDLEDLAYLLEVAENSLTSCTCPQCTLWASVASRYIEMVDKATD